MREERAPTHSGRIVPVWVHCAAGGDGTTRSGNLLPLAAGERGGGLRTHRVPMTDKLSALTGLAPDIGSLAGPTRALSVLTENTSACSPAGNLAPEFGGIF